MSEKRQAVGYVRVSTLGQATDGAGLDKQEKAIKETAALHSFDLQHIYKDVGTASGPYSHLRRDELQDALKVAKQQKWPLIVSRLNRLSREPEAMNGILQLDGVRIISANPAEMMTPEALKQTIERARRTSDNISLKTKEGHAKRKASGRKSGRTDIEGLREASQLSARSRQNRADEIVDHIAAVLQRQPELLQKTAAELAEHLNAMGILSGWGRPWTQDGIRRPLKEAKARLKERQELAALPYDDFDVPAKDAVSIPDPERGPDAEHNPYAENPNYGKF